MVDWSIETLRDLSPILAIVFFITSTILVLKLRSKKSLAHEKVTDSSLIVGEAIKPEVDILFRGEKVEDVHLLEVRIINNGNKHVKEEDFKKPITFEFNPDAEIMEMSAEKRSSDGIQISFKLLAENRVEITPNLLNKKDWFIAKFLLNKYDKFDLSLHAIDMGEIKEYNPPYMYLNTILAMVFAAVAGSIFSGFFRDVLIDIMSPLIDIMSLIFIIFLCFFVGFWLAKRENSFSKTSLSILPTPFMIFQSTT